MITDLPPEILYCILSYVLAIIPSQSLSLRLICSQFNNALSDGYVWGRYVSLRTQCVIKDKMDLVVTCGKKSLQVYVTLVRKGTSGNFIVERTVGFKISPMVFNWVLCACYAAGRLNIPPHKMLFYHQGKSLTSREIMHKRAIDITNGNHKDAIVMEAIRFE